jgi:isoquinoline 1-oxidoreductase beta subunit
MTSSISRRSFLQTAAATVGAALSVGFDTRGALAMTSQAGGSITPFVKIYPDGTVDNARYANLAFGSQGTGGSSSIANSFMQYRTAAAATREVLLNAAAQAWGTPVDTLVLRDGVITGAGKSSSISAFVDAAASMDIPTEPRLKDPSEWQVIGVDQKARLDTPAKINGSAIFSMDIQLDNQMVVAMKRTPRMGGVVASFDDTAARDISGFIMAIAMPNQKGVMVYAETTWAAFQARDALDIEWDFSAAENGSSDALKAELLAMVNSPSEFQASETDEATASDAISDAAQVVEREFYFPLLAHAPMEAMGATIEPLENGGVRLHDGAQSPAAGHAVLSQVLELPMEKVEVNTLYAGGFFGRRSTPDADYLVELALAFVVTDRSRPVKLQWSREDDIAGGYYRPAYAHKVRVGLDQNGDIVGWDHRIAGQSIFKGTLFESFLVQNGVDNTSVEGVRHNPYQIPTHFIGLTDQSGPTTPNWWRSVGHSHTAYAMECMMDLCAQAAGKDPVAYRLAYLTGDGVDQNRMSGVIRMAAEKAGWGQPLPDGHFHGFAAHKSFGSYVAEVCEISTDGDGTVTIEKVTAAVDCGIAVTPDVIRAQVEGGIGYGIGHVMRAEVTLEEGAPVQSNFHDYETLRIYDLSNIETHIVPSTEAPTGIGEPGTPPAGPALANAISASGAALTTHLPMTANGVNFS